MTNVCYNFRLRHQRTINNRLTVSWAVLSTAKSVSSGFMKALYHTWQQGEDGVGFSWWAASRSECGLLSMGQIASKGRTILPRHDRPDWAAKRRERDEKEGKLACRLVYPLRASQTPDTRSSSSCLGDETGMALTNISIYDVRGETWQARTTVRSTVS
jgi:hypothetical protein